MDGRIKGEQVGFGDWWLVMRDAKGPHVCAIIKLTPPTAGRSDVVSSNSLFQNLEYSGFASHASPIMACTIKHTAPTFLMGCPTIIGYVWSLFALRQAGLLRLADLEIARITSRQFGSMATNVQRQLKSPMWQL